MKKNISISLDEEQIEKIEQICKVSERTKSWLVVKAVDNYLEDVSDMEIALERSMDSKKLLLSEAQLRNNLKDQEHKD